MGALSAQQEVLAPAPAAQAGGAAPGQETRGVGGAHRGGSDGTGGTSGEWRTAEAPEETPRRAQTAHGGAGAGRVTRGGEGGGAGGASSEPWVAFGSAPSPSVTTSPSPGTTLPDPAAAASGFYYNGDGYAPTDTAPARMSPPLAAFFPPPTLQHKIVLSWAGSSGGDAAIARMDDVNEDRLSMEEKGRILAAVLRARRESRAVEIRRPPPPKPPVTPPSNPTEAYPSPASPSVGPAQMPQPPNKPFAFSPSVTAFLPRQSIGHTIASPSPSPSTFVAEITPSPAPLPHMPIHEPATPAFPSCADPSPARSPAPSYGSRPSSVYANSSALAALDAYGSDSGSEAGASSAAVSGSRSTTPNPIMSRSRDEPHRTPSPSPDQGDAADQAETPSAPSPRASGTRTPPNSPEVQRVCETDRPSVAAQPAEAACGEAEMAGRQVDTGDAACTGGRLEEQLEEAAKEVEVEGGAADSALLPVERGPEAEGAGANEVKEDGKAQGEVAVLERDRPTSPPEGPGTPEGAPLAKKARTRQSYGASDEAAVGKAMERAAGPTPEPAGRFKYTGFLHTSFGTPASQQPPIRSDALVRAPARAEPTRVPPSPWPAFFPDGRFTAVADDSNPFTTPPFPLQTNPSAPINPTALPFFPPAVTRLGHERSRAAALPASAPVLPNDAAFQTVRALLDAAQARNGVYERKLQKYAAMHESDRKRIEALEARHGADAADVRALEADVARLSGIVDAGQGALAQVRRALDERSEMYRRVAGECGAVREQLAHARKELAGAPQRTNADGALEREQARAQQLAGEAGELRTQLADAEKARDKVIEHWQTLETAQVVAEHLRTSRDEAREWRSKAEDERVAKACVSADLKIAVKAREAMDKDKRASAPTIRSILVTSLKRHGRHAEDLANTLNGALTECRILQDAIDKGQAERSALIAAATLREQKIADCEKARDSAIAQRDHVITLLVTAEEHAGELTRSLDEGHERARELVALSDELEKTCRAQVEAMRAALADETKRADDAKAAHAKLVSQAVAKLKELQTEDDRMRSAQSAAASQQLADTRGQLRDAQARLAVEGQRLEAADRARDALRAMYDDATTALEEEKRARVSIENKVRDDELERINAQLDPATGPHDKIRGLEQLIAERDRKVKRAEEDRLSADAQLDEVVKQRDEMMTKMEVLQREQSAVEQELLDVKSKRGTGALGGRTFVSRVARGAQAQT
ncbi:hypothetical protein JCM3770_005072 [Rhodotorula araucariae]